MCNHFPALRVHQTKQNKNHPSIFEMMPIFCALLFQLLLPPGEAIDYRKNSHMKITRVNHSLSANFASHTSIRSQSSEMLLEVEACHESRSKASVKINNISQSGITLWLWLTCFQLQAYQKTDADFICQISELVTVKKALQGRRPSCKSPLLKNKCMDIIRLILCDIFRS